MHGTGRCAVNEFVNATLHALQTNFCMGVCFNHQIDQVLAIDDKVAIAAVCGQGEVFDAHSLEHDGFSEAIVFTRNVAGSSKVNCQRLGGTRDGQRCFSVVRQLVLIFFKDAV